MGEELQAWPARSAEGEPPAKRRAIAMNASDEVHLEGFREKLRHLAELSPQLKNRRDPGVRICGEEVYLERAAADTLWPPESIPAWPTDAYFFEGLSEIRICCVAALSSVPSEIGAVRGLQSLVLMSDNLTELPVEVGQLHCLTHIFLNGNFLTSLPKAVCDLPRLQELCIDNNLIESLHPIASPALNLLTAPGNRLKRLPAVGSKLARLEAYGNQLVSMCPFGIQSVSHWGSLATVKIMGNQIRELPSCIGDMHGLRRLNVASNVLKSLPQSIVRISKLEWVIAYDNAMEELPNDLLSSCGRLERLLLEGNPFRSRAVEDLLVGAAAHKKLKTLGMDSSQLCDYKAQGNSQMPACVKEGQMVGLGGPGEHYYMKLVSWQQLHRSGSLLAAAPVRKRGCCSHRAAARDDKAECLVVAFSASQAEPEWLGLFGRIAQSDCCTDLPPVIGSLERFLSEQGISKGRPFNSLSQQEREACISALWSGFVRTTTGGATQQGCAHGAADTNRKVPTKFDVLSVVDHSMSWYAAEADAFSNALQNITRPYKRVLFVGASMGGFGAMLHGGRLADAVIAFGPQSRLSDASLRPRGQSMDALLALSAELQESIRMLASRGASVDIHCAADDHFWHAMQLPLRDFALTLHPLCPRKPFARLLDRCNMLKPVIADCFLRLQRSSATPFSGPLVFEKLAACGGLLGNGVPSKEGRGLTASLNIERSVGVPPCGQVGVASWMFAGGFERYSATVTELLHIFFVTPLPYCPRPGNWYCPKCNQRNNTTWFFCKEACGLKDSEARVDLGRRVLDGSGYPQSGDWGCGNCGAANFSCYKYCDTCWKHRAGASNYVMP